VLTYGGGLTFFVTLLSCLPGGNGSIVLMTCIFVTILYVALTVALTYLLRSISSAGQNERLLNITTAVICLAVPLLMAQQEWDDHDRSKKTTAPDTAKDYLESCAPNAIIFTFGDNDTYPLWYAQEVEGVRPDIRIINNSLLGIDWYINQLRYKVNQADSLDVLWTPEQIEGHNREYLRYQAQGEKDAFYDLYDVMKNVLGKPNIDPETNRDVGYGSFPVARFRVPVDTALVRQNGTANPTDSVLSELLFEVPQNKLSTGIFKSDLIILNIIATNKWKRPIYFTSPFGDLGFAQYLRKDGLAYRLVPVKNNFPQSNWVVEQTSRQLRFFGTQIRDNNSDVIFNNLMTKFVFGGADKKGVYYDEENRRHLLNIRSLFAEAAGNLADAGRKEDAQKLLAKCEAGILAENLPYAMVSRFSNHNQTGLIYLEAFYKAGKMDDAERIRQAVRKDMEQQKRYYDYLRNNRPEFFPGIENEAAINEGMLEVLNAVEAKYVPQLRTQPVTPGNINDTLLIRENPKRDSLK
jgi:hypothetical protein